MLLLALLSSLWSACQQELGVGQLGVKIDFACRAEREASDTLDLIIRAEGCKGRRAVFYISLRRGQEVETLPALPPGRYGIEARARAQGRVVATRCIDQRLPAQHDVELLLGAGHCGDGDGAALVREAGAPSDAETLRQDAGVDDGCAASCDDHNGCTQDRCVAGECNHELLAGELECDGVACTRDRCVEGTCDAVPDHAVCPDDGDLCTDAVCDPTQGCIARANQASCSDGRDCTSGDSCAGGECVPGEDICPDGASCTATGCACATATQTPCASGCTSLASDAQHCGSCTRACVGEATCQNGACRPRDVPASCTAYPYGGHDYLFCTQELSWASARAACRGYGNFDLVIIDAPEENTFVGSQGQLVAAGKELWLGANDRGNSAACSCSGGEEGSWDWVDPGSGQEEGAHLCDGNGTCAPASGMVVGFASPEPNNNSCDCIGCVCEVGQDCALMYPSGTWDDQDCGASRGYVCERY